MLTPLELQMLTAAHERSPEYDKQNNPIILAWAEDAKDGDDIQQALFNLIQKGLVTIAWDPEDQDTVFTKAVLN